MINPPDRHQQDDRIQCEQFACAGLFRLLKDRSAGFQAQIEAGTHHTGQKSDKQTFRQREILYSRFLFLLGHITGAKTSGIPDHGDTGKRDTHTDQQDQAIAMKQIRSAKNCREKRPETGTRSKRDALAERNPK